MNDKVGTYTSAANLSSETLFHFTGSFETLKLILANGFQARYIYEKLPGRRLGYVTNAVCCCDIPLGLIREHMNWYGVYGIGINRAVAKEHGFSPVTYMHSKSPLYPKGSSRTSAEWFAGFHFTRTLKQVRGKQLFFAPDGKPYWKWKTFYNEREWRYYPPHGKTEVLPYGQEIELADYRRELNATRSLPHLSIDPAWIEYIFIKDPKELGELCAILKNAPFADRYEELLTKVFTFRQIQRDF